MKQKKQACDGCQATRRKITRFASGAESWCACVDCLKAIKTQTHYEFPKSILMTYEANILISCLNERRQERGLPYLPPQFPTPPEQQREAVAKAFSACLNRWLNPAQWAELLAKNKTDPSDSCSSHEYCDANMAMDEAFRIVLGRPLLLPCDIEGDKEKEAEHEKQNELWATAWELAKQRGFFAPDMPPAGGDLKPTAEELADVLRKVVALEESTKGKGLLDVSSVALQDTYTAARTILKRFDA